MNNFVKQLQNILNHSCLLVSTALNVTHEV